MDISQKKFGSAYAQSLRKYSNIEILAKIEGKEAQFFSKIYEGHIRIWLRPKKNSKLSHACVPLIRLTYGNEWQQIYERKFTKIIEKGLATATESDNMQIRNIHKGDEVPLALYLYQHSLVCACIQLSLRSRMLLYTAWLLKKVKYFTLTAYSRGHLVTSMAQFF